MHTTILPNGKRLEFVASFRIYVTPAGELVMPAGNCRMYVEEERARAFLEDLLSLAEKFKAPEREPSEATA